MKAARAVLTSIRNGETVDRVRGLRASAGLVHTSAVARTTRWAVIGLASFVGAAGVSHRAPAAVPQIAAAAACESGEPVRALLRPLDARPTARVGRFAYPRGVRVKTFRSESVAVHYAATGRHAPPRRDTDRDKTPDYVEEAAAAADAAAAAYRNPGFRLRLPRCDRGRDNRPDIYLRRSSIPGIAVEPARSATGSFIVVSTTLTPGTARSLTSLRLVVAHELFHLVQFTYAPAGVPRWIAEGTANALAIFGAIPAGGGLLVDHVLLTQLDRWMLEPWRSIFDDQDGCARCYGGALWWLQILVDLGRPDVLHELFTRLATSTARDRGVSDIDASLRALGWNLTNAFATFATDLYRKQPRVGTVDPINAAAPTGAAVPRPLLGLAAHYLPINVPASSGGLDVRIRSLEGPLIWIRLIVGGQAGREVNPNPLTPESTHLVFPVRFANAAERQQIIVIVTNGNAERSRYEVSWIHK
jgi:hypothetical protein